jgi:hypothetical protein
MGLLKRSRNRRRLKSAYIQRFGDVSRHEASLPRNDVGIVCPTWATTRAWFVLDSDLDMNPTWGDTEVSSERAYAALTCLAWWLVRAGEEALTGDSRGSRLHADLYVPLSDDLRARFLPDGEAPDVDECYLPNDRAPR